MGIKGGVMKSLLGLLFLLLVSMVYAAEPWHYQVTGALSDASNDVIIVQKGTQK